MAEQSSEKGRRLMTEAQNKLNAQSGGGCCGQAGRPKIEQACELYVKAANSFKLAKDWTSAGHAFLEAASLELENGRSHEAGNHYVEASKCYKKVSPADSAKCLEKAVEVYTDMGRQRVAAKHHQTLAELYGEGELLDLQKNVHHNMRAFELFTLDDSKSAANKCQLEIAKNSALLGDYDKAVEIYEEVGKQALDSSLLKYIATDLFLRAGLCKLYMCASTDAESSASKINECVCRYEDLNPSFAESRERNLLLKLAQATTENDEDAFNEAIRSHESVSRLEPWYHEILRSLRKYVKGEPDMR